MPIRAVVLGSPVVVHTNVRPVRWLGKLGLTLGRHIFLGPPAAEVWPALLAHEMGHVKQWEAGRLRFVWQYALGLLTHGYRRHPLERDAMAFQRMFDQHVTVLAAVRAMGGRV